SLGDSIFLEALEIETVAQIVARVWEYPEGSGLEAYHDSAAAAGWRKPAYPGEFQIIFRAIDSRGAAGMDTVTVTVNDTLPPPPPPVVEIISPAAETTVVLGDSIFFEAGITPAGVALEWQAWNYGEDSGLEADSVDAPGWRRFDQAGVFSVSFTVQDTLGRQSADTVEVTVNQNQPPTADITSPAADTTVARGVSIEFIATDGDDDGVIAARAWSWEQGSGITFDPVADSTAQPGSRTFLTPGTFKVRYTVTDNHGAQAGDSVSVTVESNQLPYAQITSMSGDTTIAAGDSVPLDGTGQDPDGTEVSTQWSYRPDPGEPVVLAPFEPPGFLRLDQEGTYWVFLTVTDSAGASASDSARVLVEPIPPNDPPTARIINPSRDTVVVQWCRVSFAGEDSDPDGQVVSRSWSNGLLESIDPATDTTAVIGPKLINVPGTIRILYTVADDRGDSYSAWRILTVLANFHPTAEIISPDRDVTISAGGIVSFAAKDSDPGGTVVRREWDYGNSGILPDSVAVPGNRTFNTQGTFKIIYKVTDNLGISWSDSLTVTVGAL
ncbi:MAG: PKD domain-containing protein, partial [Candidatus Glassbacteria bacterium]|nr:PKD domain-containing protein [Candidatus Glassbacteria bacterium]